MHDLSGVLVDVAPPTLVEIGGGSLVEVVEEVEGRESTTVSKGQEVGERRIV